MSWSQRRAVCGRCYRKVYGHWNVWAWEGLVVCLYLAALLAMESHWPFTSSWMGAIRAGLLGGAFGWGMHWVMLQYIRPYIRQELRHVCLHCGYDLTGNVSGVCPECGCPVGEVREVAA